MSEIHLHEINELMRKNAADCIKQADHDYLCEIDRAIHELKMAHARVLLLAGPSSSGKTTTANIMRERLARDGYETVIISMDDFYRDKDDPCYPLDENGMQDYESVDSLHLTKIKDCLAKLLEGESTFIPKYSFEMGKAEEKEVFISPPKKGFVIMEGLHALNPIMTEGLDSTGMIKIFISVSTNINEGETRILSGRKIRFIRRMTRDAFFRGTDAFSTLARWHSVLSGEDKYLYPFRENANFKINTFHKYELSVIKPFADKVLKSSKEKLCGDYIKEIIEALRKIEPADAALLSDSSLIKEFIPNNII